jgi:S1-C subfamily serine protease
LQIESAAQGAPPASDSIAQAVDPALVDVDAVGLDGTSELGTGVVLTAAGLIVTNDHVIDGAAQVRATDVGDGQTYDATVIGTDQPDDLAVLQLESANGLQVASTGDSSSVFLGEGVVAVGNAHGAGGTPSYAGGMLTALSRHIVEVDDADGWSAELDGLLETNADILPGDSGGPLVDGNGDVVGIDTAILDSAPGGFAIPINEVLEVVGAIEDQAG